MTESVSGSVCKYVKEKACEFFGRCLVKGPFTHWNALPDELRGPWFQHAARHINGGLKRRTGVPVMKSRVRKARMPMERPPGVSKPTGKRVTGTWLRLRSRPYLNSTLLTTWSARRSCSTQKHVGGRVTDRRQRFAMMFKGDGSLLWTRWGR